MNLIRFHSFHSENKNAMEYKPTSVKNNIPEWYINKEKFAKNADGSYDLKTVVKDGKTFHHKQHTWKSCPALLDIFLSGYYLLTPCDIEVKKNEMMIDETYPPVIFKFDQKWNNSTNFEDWSQDQFGFPICGGRGIQEGLPYPKGYYPYGYYWIPNWFAQVPENYTLLFTHPMNIENLPFKTMSGFVDSSNILVLTGKYPFYIKEDWEGVIPAGTPFAQVIPIKNESWQSQIVDHTYQDVKDLYFRKKNEYSIDSEIPGNLYKIMDWLKKRYE